MTQGIFDNILSSWQCVVMSKAQFKSRTPSAEAFTQLILEVFDVQIRQVNQRAMELI